MANRGFVVYRIFRREFALVSVFVRGYPLGMTRIVGGGVRGGR